MSEEHQAGLLDFKKESDTSQIIEKAQNFVLQQNSEDEKYCRAEDDIIYKKIRSIEHIKFYLKHFLPPNISLTFMITSLIIQPSHIVFNVGFIIYNFIKLITSNEENYNKTYLKTGNYIVVLFEFTGICILLLIIIVSLLRHNICVVVDSIKECGSWSSFQVFYKFNYKSILKYYATCYSQHKSRLNKTHLHKNQEYKQLQRQIAKEMQRNVDNPNYQVEKMQKILNKLSILSEMQELKKVRKKDEDPIEDQMIRTASWSVFLIITLIFLGFGMTALLLKLAQFSYINEEEITHWSAQQCITFLGFCNQIWSIANADTVRMDAIYRFIFTPQNGKNTRYTSNQIAVFDATIKETLWNEFGIRGLLIAISMNSTFLHKLIVQDPMDDFSVNELLMYGRISDTQSDIQQNIQNKNENNNIHSDKDTVKHRMIRKWNQFKLLMQHIFHNFMMKDKQQPLHPCIVAEHLILRYGQKLDSIKSKASDIKVNHFMIIPDIFEGVEIIVKYVYWIVVGISILSLWIFSILSIVLEWNTTAWMTRECVYYAYQYSCLVCVISLPVGIMSLPIAIMGKKVENDTVYRLLRYLFLFTLSGFIYNLMATFFLTGCFVPDLLVVSNVHFSDYCFMYLVANGVLVVSICSAIIVAIVNFMMTSTFMYLILFFCFMCICGLRVMAVMSVPLLLVWQIVDIMAEIMKWQQSTTVLIFSVVTMVVIIWFFIFSILYHWKTKHYRQPNDPSITRKWDVAYLCTLVLIGIFDIIMIEYQYVAYVCYTLIYSLIFGFQHGDYWNYFFLFCNWTVMYNFLMRCLAGLLFCDVEKFMKQCDKPCGIEDYFFGKIASKSPEYFINKIFE